MNIEFRKEFLYLITILWFVHSIEGKNIRWKRQALPSTHVQVHSLNSNVSVTNAVQVVSAESRIDLKESFLNASIWSSSSELLFDNFDTYVNYTAFDVEDIFYVQSAVLHKQANKTQFSMVTNRTQNGQSNFNERLDGSVSLRVNDSNMGVQALNGSWALINGQTWNEKVEKRINVFSALDSNDNERKLLIRAESNVYEVKIILSSAEVQIEYGPSVIQIDRSYRHMMIFTNKRNISLDTITSPFEVSMTENQLLVTCKDERTVATLSPNSTDVGISVGQYSKLEVDRGKGMMSVGNDAAISERVNVTSMHLQLDLEDDVIRANTNRSHIEMMGNLTKVGLTAAVHNLTVTGGVPRMILDTGNITVKVLAVEERAILPSIVPVFVMPKDNYDSLGPVRNEGIVDGSSNGEPEPNPFTKQGNEEPTRVTSRMGTNEEPLTRESKQPTQGMAGTTEETITTPIQSVTTSSLPTPPPLTIQPPQPEEPATPPPFNPFGPIDPVNPVLTPSPIVTTTTQQPVQTEGANTDVTPIWSDLTLSSGQDESHGDTIHRTTLPGGMPIDPGPDGEPMVVSGSPGSEANPGLELFATINNMDIYTTESPSIPTVSGQSQFPRPEGIQGKRRRFARAVNDALVMRLFVPDTVNTSDPEFRSSIQNDLTTAVRESVSGSEKRKRSTDEKEFDVDLTDIGKDGGTLSLHFIVFEEPSGQNTNHSAIAEAMNLLGVTRLSQDMHYPVVDVIHVSLDSSLVWISLSMALSVLLIFVVVLIGWKFSIHEKLKRRILDQSQAKENEIFQKTGQHD